MPTLLSPASQHSGARWTEVNVLLIDLIWRARGGDIGAFEEFYNRTRHWLLSHVRRYVDDGQAEDVLADVYLQAWRGLSTFDADRAPPGVWLAMIARSRALDHLRREKRCSEAVDGVRQELQTRHELDDGPEELLSRQQHRGLVRLSLEGAPLSADERTAIGLAYFRECSHQEIATLTGWPLGTVKSIITRAQDKLRAAFGAVPAVPAAGGYHPHP